VDVSETHDDKRAALERERTHLVSRLAELKVGGAAALDFDDDFADRGQVASEQGENRSLADTLEVQLGLVDRAITRIDEGTYGNCEICDEAIGSERLAAMPSTHRCISHA
jgi:DnaK suppressor protein